ncbi:MAG TPA: hypothetical protein ENK66_08585, partial [Arcobacter sp.]|nr:hypothetical protein [Arcobacter sp.]
MGEKKGKIISISNTKGGVTKTTTSSWLAREISKSKNRVLLIDLDPQGSLTEL